MPEMRAGERRGAVIHGQRWQSARTLQMLPAMADNRHTGGGPNSPLGWALSRERSDPISMQFRVLALEIVGRALWATSSREQAAHELGVGLRTLYRWLREYPLLARIRPERSVAATAADTCPPTGHLSADTCPGAHLSDEKSST